MNAGHPFDAVVEADLRRRRSAKWSKYPADVLPAFVAEMDFPAAPAIQRVLAAAVADSDYGYAPNAGEMGLLDAVAAWMQRVFRWSVDPASIVAMNDVVNGLDIGVRAFSEPGGEVIVTPPVYPPFLNTPIDNARVRREVPLLAQPDGSWKMDLDGIDAAMAGGAKVMLLCHPHNPTGTVWTAETLDGLAALADRHGAWIVSDEIHAPLTFPGHTHIPLASRSAMAAARTLTLTSASKAWSLPGLKCAAMIAGSDEVMARVMALPRRTRSGIGSFGEFAMLAAITEGQTWLDDVVAYLDGNRRWLTGALPDGIGYRPPDATYLCWLDCRSLGLEPDPYTFFLDQAKVAMNPGADFGEAFGGFVRLNIATSRPLLARIVDRMAAALPRRR